jgi:hypothetical protein
MGFFSWNCSCCGRSIRRRGGAGIDNWMSKATAVCADGSVAHGEYDGYGRLDSRLGEIELTEGGEFSLFHTACWEHAGKPGFKGQSASAKDQGYFCSEVLSIYPPGADTDTVREKHSEEIHTILTEIVPVIEAMKIDTLRFSIVQIATIFRERHDDHIAAIRAKFAKAD